MQLAPTIDWSNYGPNSTPRTDALQQEWASEGLTWEAMFDELRQFERELRLAKCPIHDCCAARVGQECAWYDK